MLSDNIFSLLQTLRAYEETGVRLEPVAVRRICSDLEASVQDALAMEASAVAPLVKSHSDNVVVLNNERARRTLEGYAKQCGATFTVNTSNDQDDAA